jgi:glycosyltransferase involved in cell wall biosynthesis
MGETMKLSILVLTTPRRLETFFPKLIRNLEKQIGNRNDIEIIGIYDNKKRTVGEKRNNALQMANGEFLTFIDDDDRIADDYVQSIITCIEQNPNADCIVFDCITQINGKYNCLSKYSINYEYGQKGDQWRGKPAHTMVWKSAIAKKHSYTGANFGEDIHWVKRACVDIKNEVRIDKVLYFYDFDNGVSETR